MSKAGFPLVGRKSEIVGQRWLLGDRLPAQGTSRLEYHVTRRAPKNIQTNAPSAR